MAPQVTTTTIVPADGAAATAAMRNAHALDQYDLIEHIRRSHVTAGAWSSR